jgi:hypothetical protein
MKLRSLGNRDGSCFPTPGKREPGLAHVGGIRDLRTSPTPRPARSEDGPPQCPGSQLRCRRQSGRVMSGAYAPRVHHGREMGRRLGRATGDRHDLDWQPRGFRGGEGRDGHAPPRTAPRPAREPAPRRGSRARNALRRQDAPGGVHRHGNRQRRHDDALRGAPHRPDEDEHSEGYQRPTYRDTATMGVVLGVAGLASTALGVVLLYRDGGPSVVLVATVADHHVLISLNGAF